MARGFIVEEVRMTGGTMRLRDARTGEIVEVPLTLGAALALTDAGDGAPAEDIDAEEEDADADADDVDDDADDEAKRRRRRRRKRRARKEAQGESAHEEPAPAAMAVPQPEPQRVPDDPAVNESSLSPDDQAALEKFRALMSRPSRRGKKGALGWKETTVDGRSGVLARWGMGQFKILHAGGDTYALFYEWDNGKWERIACGSAEDLMRLASVRAAEDEAPTAPLNTLTLEVARLFCGTDTQKQAARERLRPVRDHGQDRPSAKRAPRKKAAGVDGGPAPRKKADDAGVDGGQGGPVAAAPTPREDVDAEVEARDRELLASFSADLEKVLDEEDD
jgi:hypothetical protein